MENRDFKYVMQDVGAIYIGAKMTCSEMITWEEVPFRWKAVVNRYLLTEDNTDLTLPQILCKPSDNRFNVEIMKQLKLKIKAGSYENKHNRTKYISRVYHYQEFIEKSKDANLWEDLFPEEVIISKLALMTIPV